MTDEQIKDLVQSYVDELFVHEDMQDKENIEAKNDALVMCMAFAGHILETHCIVEKEVVRLDFAYNHRLAIQFSKGGSPMCDKMKEWHQGKCDELISLSGKELFNGKEE